MHLTIDIGNTRIKYTKWDETQSVLDTGDVVNYDALQSYFNEAETISWCSTRHDSGPDFSNFTGRVFSLSHDSKLPFRTQYTTPQTLGRDRIAGIAGAVKLFPQTDVLVLDAGTCLTFDLVTKNGTHEGGSISPGLNMRYQALQQLTGKLPFIAHRNFNQLLGKSTEESILTGVFRGFVAEIESRIDEILEKWPTLEIIGTGGDLPILGNQLKYRIFAEPLLLHHGLLYCSEINEF